MRSDDGGQMLIIAAILIAMGMAALAFATYSSISAESVSLQQGTEDAGATFINVEETYEQAVRLAWEQDKDNPGPELEVIRQNMTRWFERQGYTVTLLPKNASSGYDTTNSVFNGSLVMTDGTTTFRDELNLDLTD